MQSTYRWVRISLTASNWPQMAANTYYWLALLPGSTWTLPTLAPPALTTQNNGVLWAAYPDVSGTVVTGASLDPSLYTARQLATLSAANTGLKCDEQASVNFYQTGATSPYTASSFNWFSAGAPRFTSFASSGYRYGFQLQGTAIGSTAVPTRSATATRTRTAGAVTRTATTTRTATRTRTATVAAA